MSEKDGFKGCPFCGVQPEVHKHHREELWSLIHRCPTFGTLLIDWQSSIANLQKKWNTRAERNEHSSPEVLAIAGRGWKKPESLSLKEIQSVCASVATQAPDKPKPAAEDA